MRNKDLNITGIVIGLMLLISLIFSGCKEDEAEKANEKYNNHDASPVTDAGGNATHLAGTTVILSGSVIDLEGSDVTYQWSIISKPNESNASLTNESTLSPSITLDVIGEFVFLLTGRDGSFSTTSTITITSFNTVPVANAGTDVFQRSIGTIVLDGTKSSDPDGRTLSYSWMLTAKPSGSTTMLSNESSSSPSIDADTEGLYSISLSIDDGFYSRTDSLDIIIGPVVKDTTTSLIWQDNDYTTKHDWDSAVSYCSNLSLAGWQGWKLPSNDELVGLFNNRSILNSYESEHYWSSTPSSNFDTLAKRVHFGDGHQSSGGKSFERNVRCVRDGQ